MGSVGGGGGGMLCLLSTLAVISLMSRKCARKPCCHISGITPHLPPLQATVKTKFSPFKGRQKKINMNPLCLKTVLCPCKSWIRAFPAMSSYLLHTIVWPQQSGRLWCLSRNFIGIRDPTHSKTV